MGTPHVNITDLSAREKLRLIERLWDSLRLTPDQIPLSSAQDDELDRRLDAIDSGDDSKVPLEEALSQIRLRKH